jgi:hypothetical protein
MDLGNLENAVLQLVSIIVLALVGIAAAYVKKWIAAHIEDAELRKSILATEDVIETSVKGSIQVMSAEAEKALADGKLTDEELKKIQAAAIADYQQHVAPELQKRLDAHVLDAKVYVAKKAAAVVQSMDTVTN